MQVSVRFKYWLAFLIFGVSWWMTWQEANGSLDALTLAKGVFPLSGSASVLTVTLHLCLQWWMAGIRRPVPVASEMGFLCEE